MTASGQAARPAPPARLAASELRELPAPLRAAVLQYDAGATLEDVADRVRDRLDQTDEEVAVAIAQALRWIVGRDSRRAYLLADAPARLGPAIERRLDDCGVVDPVLRRVVLDQAFGVSAEATAAQLGLADADEVCNLRDDAAYRFGVPQGLRLRP